MSRHSVSDEELDNARHEVEFCFNQFTELAPWAQEIMVGRLKGETLSDKLLNKMETDQWDGQFGGLLLKTIGSQVKYIKLLEKRIGK
jgi:hypothetical protein